MDESNNEYHFQGADLAIESAKALFKVAGKSSEIGEYGIARSLYILAGEEAVKSFTIASQVAKESNERSEGWDKVFKDHKTKHDGLKMATFLMNFSTKTFDEHYRKMTKAGIPMNIIEKTLNSNPLTRDELRWYKKMKLHPITMEEATSWWDAANLEKNKGFYVDERKGAWWNPRSVTREQAKQGEKYAGFIIEFIAKVITDLRSPEVAQLLKDNPMPPDMQ